MISYFWTKHAAGNQLILLGDIAFWPIKYIIRIRRNSHCFFNIIKFAPVQCGNVIQSNMKFNAMYIAAGKWSYHDHFCFGWVFPLFSMMGVKRQRRLSSLIKDVIFFLNVADSEEGALDIFGKLVSVLGERSLGIHDVGLSEINTYLKSKDSKGERSRDRIYYWHEAYRNGSLALQLRVGGFCCVGNFTWMVVGRIYGQRERSGRAEVLADGIARCGKCIFEAMPMCFANWQRSARDENRLQGP